MAFPPIFQAYIRRQWPPGLALNLLRSFSCYSTCSSASWRAVRRSSMRRRSRPSVRTPLGSTVEKRPTTYLAIMLLHGLISQRGNSYWFRVYFCGTEKKIGLQFQNVPFFEFRNMYSGIVVFSNKMLINCLFSCFHEKDSICCNVPWMAWCWNWRVNRAMRILGQDKRVKLGVLPHHEPIFATLNVSIFPRIERGSLLRWGYLSHGFLRTKQILRLFDSTFHVALHKKGNDRLLIRFGQCCSIFLRLVFEGYKNRYYVEVAVPSFYISRSSCLRDQNLRTTLAVNNTNNIQSHSCLFFRENIMSLTQGALTKLYQGGWFDVQVRRLLTCVN